MREIFNVLEVDTNSADPYAETMNVHLTEDQKAFIRQAIEAGRFQREEDAVEEALALWEERERARAEILADIDLAESSLAQAKGRTITEQSMRELATEVKQRGRARLDAEQRTPR
jgi:putative addiction module CopG family antidote